jgi:hypothetical protein
MNRMAADEPTPPELIDDSDDLEVVAVSPEHPLRVGAIVSVRFDPDSTRLLQQAAALDGVTQSEFIRRAAMQAARKSIAHTT